MANIQIPITENGTTTLATAGKYCDRNIDVNTSVAGSGVETATITFFCRQDWSNSVLYVNEAQELAAVTITPGSSLQLTVVKHSIIQISSIDEIAEMTGAIESINNSGLYFVGGDCTFKTEMALD